VGRISARPCVAYAAIILGGKRDPARAKQYRTNMRRLGMKNKRRKSETSDSSEENGGARIASNNANESRSSKNNTESIANSAAPAARKSPSKRRSLRSVPVQKPVAHAADDIEMKDDSVELSESERENGEKVTGRKSALDKRRKKVDRKASTSANEKPNAENEYEVRVRGATVVFLSFLHDISRCRVFLLIRSD